MMVAALYVRRDSIYKVIPWVDAWDIDRDARLWPGGAPVVAHPPCRAWGRLAHMAKPRHDERELALHAVDMVRQFGGVLEHPSGSRLWSAAGLPTGDQADAFGGFTLDVNQSWWGHLAPKRTWLYVCGVSRSDVPSFPIDLRLPPKLVDSSKRSKGRMSGLYLPKSQREVTPVALAEWLVGLARRAARRQAA
jgi:hypothetical protein